MDNRKPKLIKYSELMRSKEVFDTLTVDEDKAIADFRAFYAVGDVHTRRVKNQKAIDVMMEVLERLKNNLQAQIKVVS